MFENTKDIVVNGAKAGRQVSGALTLTNTLAEGKTHSLTYECALSCTSGITQSQT